ncbi:HD-GYP domain-containing protein [Paludibacterium paludis]|uniref:HD-GYP domain-containing protein n=1 Tax=Paludibacterium paludis TaxID=1225769 RepID=UPI0016788B6A|nr:HD domain-containing phosphohydrolase [Paludibacterium paludis]
MNLTLSLPASLFATNRLCMAGPNDFRLSASFRDVLLHGSSAELPVALPAQTASPLHDVPLLLRHLNGVLHHYLRLPHSAQMIRGLADSLISRVNGNPDGYLAAMWLLPSGDYHATRHALHCAILAVFVVRARGFSPDDARSLVAAALTMNVGAVSLHDELSEREGAPTTFQRQMLDIHPLVSAAILREAGEDDELWYQAVLLHHEKPKGDGYPFHLKGGDVPDHAHILHVLDMATAKLMPRGYRGRLSVKKALTGIYTATDDPLGSEIAALLIKTLGFYPPGSFVELTGGRRALVVRAGSNANHPLVSPEHAPATLLDTGLPAHHVVKAITVAIDANRLSLFEGYWRKSSAEQETGGAGG